MCGAGSRCRYKTRAGVGRVSKKVKDRDEDEMMTRDVLARSVGSGRGLSIVSYIISHERAGRV